MDDEPADGRGNAPDVTSLSERERDVLSAALEGLSARAIASRLSLTEATVRSHLSAIYSKLGVAGRVELMARLSMQENRQMSDPSTPTLGREPSSQPPAKRRQVSARALVATLTFLVAVVAVALFVAWQLALPRQTDLGHVSQLITSNAVEKLDLSGSTLTVTEKNGELLRVESVTADTFQQIQTAAVDAGVAVHASSGSPASPLSQLTFIVTLLLPVVVIAALLLVVVRLIRRPPRMRYAG
jgi:DNA-binding CsgD family transcriptional regulator